MPPDMTDIGKDIPAAGPLIEISGVHYAYEDGVPALAGASLAAAPGERIVVLGANG